MRTTRLCVPLLAAALIALPMGASAQIPAIGIYGVHSTELQDGTNGLGARLHLGLPVIPLDFALSGEWFLVDCPVVLGEEVPCGYAGAEAAVNFSPFPFPMVNPYISGGLVLRATKDGSIDPDASYETETGASFGIGVLVSPVAIPFGVFVEAKKEWVYEDADDTIVRLGIQLGG